MKGETEKKKTSKFIEREWNEEIKGTLDKDGFFITPNGSFWDPDYVYFNRDGFDKHGGYYNDNGVYIPGKGWDEENNCYESEKEDDEFNNEYDDVDLDDKGINYYDNNCINDLEDDLFDGDVNDPYFKKVLEECTINTKNEENKNDKKKEEKLENSDEKNEENNEKKEEKDKNNDKQKGKIIITRENQEKYLEGKILEDIKKNNEEKVINDNNESKHNENKGNINKDKNFTKEEKIPNEKNNNRNQNNNIDNNIYNNNNNNYSNYNYNNMNQFMMNGMMYNPFFIPMNQMTIQNSQIPPNQTNKMGETAIPNPYPFVSQGIPMIPIPFGIPMGFPMMNPMLAQSIYTQDMMRKNEVERLNQNYEYQLNRHKIAESYRVVDDKNNNNN